MMVGSTATLVRHHQGDGAVGHAVPVQQRQGKRTPILDGPIGQKVMDKAAGQGAGRPRLLGETAFRNMTNNKRPITRMEDFDASSCA